MNGSNLFTSLHELDEKGRLALCILVSGLSFSLTEATQAQESDSTTTQSTPESIQSPQYIPSYDEFLARRYMARGICRKELSDSDQNAIYEGLLEFMPRAFSLEKGARIAPLLEELSLGEGPHIKDGFDYNFVFSGAPEGDISRGDPIDLSVANNTITFAIGSGERVYNLYFRSVQVFGGRIDISVQMRVGRSSRYATLSILPHPNGKPLAKDDWVRVPRRTIPYTSTSSPAYQTQKRIRNEFDFNGLGVLMSNHDRRMAERVLGELYDAHIKKGKNLGELVRMANEMKEKYHKNGHAVTVRVQMEIGTKMVNFEDSTVEVLENGDLIYGGSNIELIKVFPNEVNSNAFHIGFAYRLNRITKFGYIKIITHQNTMPPKEWGIDAFRMPKGKK